MRPNKRDELVEKALPLFYRHGFHATGMDLVAAETGVSKTSIYKHFRSKEELILAVLERRHREFQSWLAGRKEALAATPAGRLLALYDALGEWAAGPGFRGCLFQKAAAEFQEADDPIHARAAAHKAALRADLAALARAAGAAEPDRLARQLHLLAEGAIAATRLGAGPGAFADARAAAAALLAAAGVAAA